MRNFTLPQGVIQAEAESCTEFQVCWEIDFPTRRVFKTFRDAEKFVSLLLSMPDLKWAEFVGLEPITVPTTKEHVFRREVRHGLDREAGHGRANQLRQTNGSVGGG